MSSSYPGNAGAVTAHAAVSITNPTDGDALTAASNNAATQTLADEVAHLKARAVLNNVAAGDPVTGIIDLNGAAAKLRVNSTAELNIMSGGIGSVESGGLFRTESGGISDVDSGGIHRIKSGGVLRLEGSIQDTAANCSVTMDASFRLNSSLGFSVPVTRKYNYDSPGRFDRKIIPPQKFISAANPPAASLGFGAAGFALTNPASVAWYVPLDLPLGAAVNSIHIGALDATTPASTITAYILRSEMSSGYPGPLVGTYENLNTSVGFVTGAVGSTLAWQSITWRAAANQFNPTVGHFYVMFTCSSATAVFYGVFCDYYCTSVNPSA